MRSFISSLLTIAVVASAHAQQEPVPLTQAMVINTSVRIAPGTYLLQSDGSPVLTVVGQNVDVDMTGVELVGSTNTERPDQFAGTAIAIDGGDDITVRGATIRGYKVAIMARRTRNLRLIDNDLSHNWRSRLYSRIEKESLVDWMSFHQNENDEWMDKGAAIYLTDVTGGEIRGNTVTQGMNALLMTRTDSLRIWNNDFSYNSALGIGMYRSSDNVIMHNRVDYNVRGYQHGFYNRGQDSAGILMYEQCMRNTVAFNSVTHSGDGLFIWAGQTTMDTGEGGVNDNIFYGNDFSHAPTNGIENTFSSNAFVNNRVEENWHGVWGGYSWETVFLGNHFADNDEAITIEHGQDITIAGNTFDGDTTALRIWQNPTEPEGWGYPQHRDTRSRDYDIRANTFRGVNLVFNVRDTRNFQARGNAFLDIDTLSTARGELPGWSLQGPFSRSPDQFEIPARYQVAPMDRGMNAMIPEGAARGRSTIIVDEWGPFDGKSPKLWPVGRSDATPQQLRVLGPPGQWFVRDHHGVQTLSAESGEIGDTLVVTPLATSANDWSVELGYIGEDVVTNFGQTFAAGDTVAFGWTWFRPRIDWHLDFHHSPEEDVFDIALPGDPVASLDTNLLDLTWYRPPNNRIPQERLVTVATGTVRLQPGDYTLRTIADDGVIVYVDGAVVIEDRGPGESRVAEKKVSLGGSVEIVVVHYQRDGWYELRLDIER